MKWGLQKATLELRFNKGYLYWDKTGLLVNSALEIMPSLTLIEASPQKVVMREQDKSMVLVFTYHNIVAEVESMELNDKEVSKNLLKFDAVINSILQIAEIKQFTRIGERLLFAQKMESEDKANNFLDRVSTKCNFNFFKKTADENLKNKKLKKFSCRFEDEKTGIHIGLLQNKYTYVIEGTIPDEYRKELLSKKDSKGFFVCCDVDLYTLGIVHEDIFRLEELHKSNYCFVLEQILPLFDV